MLFILRMRDKILSRTYFTWKVLLLFSYLLFYDVWSKAFQTWSKWNQTRCLLQLWKAVILTLNVFYPHDLMTIWNSQFRIIVISSYFYDWMQSILTFCLINNFILIKILIAIYSQA